MSLEAFFTRVLSKWFLTDCSTGKNPNWRRFIMGVQARKAAWQAHLQTILQDKSLARPQRLVNECAFIVYIKMKCLKKVWYFYDSPRELMSSIHQPNEQASTAVQKNNKKGNFLIIRPLPYTRHKNFLNVDQDLNLRA